MAWGNTKNVKKPVNFDEIVADQTKNDSTKDAEDILAKQLTQQLIQKLSTEENVKQETILKSFANNSEETKDVKAPAHVVEPENERVPIEPEITELTDVDFALALHLAEKETAKANARHRKKVRNQEKSDLLAYQSRNSKVVLKQEGIVYEDAPEQRTIEREIPEFATKHNNVITSMKASNLFSQFEGMGDIDEAGFLFNQQTIGNTKHKMYKLRKKQER